MTEPHARLSAATVELKPCPFCGKPPVVIASTEDDSFVRCYEVRCDHCGIEVSDEYKGETIERWNTRASTFNDAQPTGKPTREEVVKAIADNMPDYYFLSYGQYNQIADAVRAIYAAQPPAALVDLTNHHNALKCPYCNPKGLQLAEPAAPVETKRKTFTIPPGHEAVRDSEGRATGEVRPRLSAATSEAGDPIRWIKDTYLMWLKGDLDPAHMRLGQHFFRAQPQVAPTQPFYGARCPSYPNCSGGCGLGCIHEMELEK